MKKKKMWVISIGLGLGAFCLAVIVFAPASRITPEHFARIEKGMSLARVESILGEKSTYSDQRGGCALHWWHGDEGNQIRVVFKHQKADSMGLSNGAGRRRGIGERTWNRFFPQYPWRFTGKQPVKGY